MQDKQDGKTVGLCWHLRRWQNGRLDYLTTSVPRWFLTISRPSLVNCDRVKQKIKTEREREREGTGWKKLIDEIYRGLSAAYGVNILCSTRFMGNFECVKLNDRR